MGTFLTDKCTELRAWMGIGADVYPDATVTSWIRMAEEYLSTALRVKHMIQIDTSIIKDVRVPMPLDWQEIRLVRLLPVGNVYTYQTPDAFFNPEWPEAPNLSISSGVHSSNGGQNKRYTILGNYLFPGGVEPVNGIKIEMTYYQDIPPLTNDANNWINKYNPTVYTLKTLHIASMYAIEDERKQTWDDEVVRLVNGLNARHQIDRASGSALRPVRSRTFG